MTKRDCALDGADCTMRLTLKGGGPVIDYLSCCILSHVQSDASMSEDKGTVHSF